MTQHDQNVTQYELRRGYAAALCHGSCKPDYATVRQATLHYTELRYPKVRYTDPCEPHCATKLLSNTTPVTLRCATLRCTSQPHCAMLRNAKLRCEGRLVSSSSWIAGCGCGLFLSPGGRTRPKGETSRTAKVVQLSLRQLRAGS